MRAALVINTKVQVIETSSLLLGLWSADPGSGWAGSFQALAQTLFRSSWSYCGRCELGHAPSGIHPRLEQGLQAPLSVSHGLRDATVGPGGSPSQEHFPSEEAVMCWERSSPELAEGKSLPLPFVRFRGVNIPLSLGSSVSITPNPRHPSTGPQRK